RLMRLTSIAIVVVAAFACETPPPTQNTDRTEVPNVTVLSGAEVVTTDTAVLVNGERLISFGIGPAGMLLVSFQEFSYGGMYEKINDELVDDQSFMDVGRRIVTDARGDTVFSRALDFGEVTLGGSPVSRFQIDTARVIEAGDEVQVYENGLLNRILIYAQRLNLDGSKVTFAHEPFYEHMLAGRAVELRASGSGDIAPTSASLRATVGARVTRLWNGSDLDFEKKMPVLRTDEPLVVELSRPLDPDRTIIVLAFFQPPPYNIDPAVADRASAVFMLKERTRRVVIPAAALADVAAHLPIAEGGLVFRIYEYVVAEDVLEIHRRRDGITEPLNFLQSNGVGFYVRMKR
ncbi:MAG: hypothetical protein ACRD2A_12175, partial [Vicinamibacterales bacterium]